MYVKRALKYQQRAAALTVDRGRITATPMTEPTNSHTPSPAQTTKSIQCMQAMWSDETATETAQL